MNLSQKSTILQKKAITLDLCPNVKKMAQFACSYWGLILLTCKRAVYNDIITCLTKNSNKML